MSFLKCYVSLDEIVLRFFILKQRFEFKCKGKKMKKKMGEHRLYSIIFCDFLFKTNIYIRKASFVYNFLILYFPIILSYSHKLELYAFSS